MNPATLLELLTYAGKLKTIPRTGWIESGVNHPESVADHSYRTALLSMLLSDSQRLDTCKVLRMALLHDLAEAETGDLTPSQKQENHTILENESMRKILAGLPDEMRRLYWDIWSEFQSKETPESVLVHDADKIEMVLQAREYREKYPEAKLERFHHALLSSNLKNIVEKIKERN